MLSLSKIPTKLKVAALMFVTVPAGWAATSPSASLISTASRSYGAGSLDDWIALLFALLAGLLCVQQRQN